MVIRYLQNNRCALHLRGERSRCKRCTNGVACSRGSCRRRGRDWEAGGRDMDAELRAWGKGLVGGWEEGFEAGGGV